MTLHKKKPKRPRAKNYSPLATAENPYKTKGMTLPSIYERGFLKKLDRRTDICRFLRANYYEILNDLGGEENLSTMQLALVEKFCFLAYSLRNLEMQIAEKTQNLEADYQGELTGRWIQGLNALLGLGKTLGLKRKPKKVESLATYVKKAKGQRKVV